MSQVTYEEVLSQIKALPPEDQARLREFLNAQDEHEPLRSSARKTVMRDYSAERRWFDEHAVEYAGQWVALKGGLLISSGTDLKAVYKEACLAGHPDALLEQIEAFDAPAFIL